MDGQAKLAGICSQLLLRSGQHADGQKAMPRVPAPSLSLSELPVHVLALIESASNGWSNGTSMTGPLNYTWNGAHGVF